MNYRKSLSEWLKNIILRAVLKELFSEGRVTKIPILKPQKIKRSLAQEVRQMSDILECRSKGGRGLLCLQQGPLCHCATCNGSSYTKNEYNFFYQKLDAEIFLFDIFFEKNSLFREGCEKLFCGYIWQFFREKGRLAPKINVTFFLSKIRYRIFYYLASFSKKAVFSEKMAKNHFWWGPSMFWREGSVWRRKWI